MLADAVACVRTSFNNGFRPDPILTVSEWADKHRMLSSKGSASPGKWRTSRAPYLREVMDNLSATSPVAMSVVMKGAQLGFTEAGHNWMGYTIHHLPCPMMIIEPTDTVMKRNIRQKIDPMIEDTPELKSRVPAKGSKEGGNSFESKEFPGGMLIFSGANSTASLRSTSIRHMFVDEIDEQEEDLNDQGDVLSIIEARTFAYGAKAKIYIPSTPTVEGRSKIADLFERSDQRYYMMPCPHCGARIKFEFHQLKMIDGDPETTYYHAPCCDGHIHEWMKTNMLAEGIWLPTKRGEFPGYHINSLYSPVGWLSWERIMKLWNAAQGKPAKLKAFVNTILGETWKERGEAPEWKKLYERREDYARNVIPMKALTLFVGVDIQKDYIAAEIVAFGRELESWSIDYRVFMGETSSLDSKCWADLKSLLREDFAHESGTCMKIDRMGIDSGYNTQTVYNFTRLAARIQGNSGRLMTTKGKEKSPIMIGIPQAKEARTDGKRAKRGVKVWHIGTNMSKEEIYSFLRQDMPTESEGGGIPYGWCHFPQYDEEFFKMLTAEQLVTKVVKGYKRTEWTKTRERNEALDCRVIARAVAYAFGVDRWTENHWLEREAFLGVSKQEVKEEEKPEEAPQNTEKELPAPPKVEARRRKSTWL